MAAWRVPGFVQPARPGVPGSSKLRASDQARGSDLSGSWAERKAPGNAKLWAASQVRIDRLTDPGGYVEAHGDRGVFFTYEAMCAEPERVGREVRAMVPELGDPDLHRRLPVKGYDEMLTDMNARRIARLGAGQVAAFNRVFGEHRDLFDHFGYEMLDAVTFLPVGEASGRAASAAVDGLAPDPPEGVPACRERPGKPGRRIPHEPMSRKRTYNGPDPTQPSRFRVDPNRARRRSHAHGGPGQGVASHRRAARRRPHLAQRAL